MCRLSARFIAVFGASQTRSCGGGAHSLRGAAKERKITIFGKYLKSVHLMNNSGALSRWAETKRWGRAVGSGPFRSGRVGSGRVAQKVGQIKSGHLACNTDIFHDAEPESSSTDEVVAVSARAHRPRCFLMLTILRHQWPWPRFVLY